MLEFDGLRSPNDKLPYSSDADHHLLATMLRIEQTELTEEEKCYAMKINKLMFLSEQFRRYYERLRKLMGPPYNTSIHHEVSIHGIYDRLWFSDGGERAVILEIRCKLESKNAVVWARVEWRKNKGFEPDEFYQSFIDAIVNVWSENDAV